MMCGGFELGPSYVIYCVCVFVISCFIDTLLSYFTIKYVSLFLFDLISWYNGLVCDF